MPGIIGVEANRYLAPFGRKSGPDPASIDACKIGGIAANNASGICCGTAQNSYQTLHGMRLILADDTLLDTSDTVSVAQFRRSHAGLLAQLQQLAGGVRDLRELFYRHRYQAVIYGHALDGNMHFVFQQSFDTQSEISRRNFKRLPAASARVGSCIECGFCESVCPSSALTCIAKVGLTAFAATNKLLGQGRLGKISPYLPRRLLQQSHL